MDCRELEQFLHENIPLSKAIGIEVQESSSEHVILSAPLVPNLNHQSMVFGGSASAVAILAAWALVYIRLRQAGLNSRLVIQKNTMLYERPISDTFVASSSVADPTTWDRFQEMFTRKHRARIAMTVTLQCNGEQVAQMNGDFVALADPVT